MKNKKLFAILTLVCFMFTLMPVAAFAGTNEWTVTNGALFYTGNIGDANKDGKTDKDDYQAIAYVAANGKTWTWANLAYGSVDTTTAPADADTFCAAYETVIEAGEGSRAFAIDGSVDYTVTAADVREALVSLNTNVAYAAAKDVSSLEAVKGDHSVSLTNAGAVEFVLNALTAGETPGYFAGNSTLYVWAVDEQGIISSALNGVKVENVTLTDNDSDYVFEVGTTALYDGDDFVLSFARDGVYTVKIGFKDGNVYKSFGNSNTITVRDGAVNPALYYAVMNNDTVVANAVTDFFTLPNVPANNVLSQEYTIAFYAGDNTPLKGKTVAIETNSSAIEVNKVTEKTSNRGEIKFRVSGSVEGTYEIDFKIDGVIWTAKVTVGNTEAAYIKLESEPATPRAQYDTLATDAIEFLITDINGNAVTRPNDGGMDGINDNTANIETTFEDGSYIILTEKPVNSDLTSEDLTLTHSGDGIWYLGGVGTMDVEGNYAVKVVLDNGAYATAKWEVKAFQTPVTLLISETPDTVELGAKFRPALVYLDVNNVAKSANDAELAATGYAIAGLNNGQVVVKTDEKYAGSTITLTAVSEKYDLVATKEVTVAAEAVAVEFESKSLEVNVNNKVDWNVVDAEGNKVSLASKYADNGILNATVKYVVLDKPEGAKVSVTGTNTIPDFRGEGTMSLTSNMVGNVTVQAVVKVTLAAGNTNDLTATQTKYYTGTQIFAVGTAGVGDVVVMSIGSNEIVINDAKATIDAAPIVENNRTFVPFRALAEAFGATVAYDEATQAVTAELNGVTVVMTIGSAEYTVNGEAKTADVAPFINGSRTMVPVRFAAEAFGIKVIPTYDENGATADILFNL